MEEPFLKETDLKLAEKKPCPAVIDVSYVELPERMTCRINLGSILGAVAFFSMLAAPAAVEGGNDILALALTIACGICAYLAIMEEGKKR